jgi:zinc protease
MQGIASKLGFYETTLGDLEFESKYIEGIHGVSSKDVREITGKYLRETGMTVSILLPDHEADALSSADILAAIESAKRELKEKTESAKSSAVESGIGGAKTTKRILTNGMTLIIKEVHANPTLAFYAAAPGGLRFESNDVNGVGSFTAAMLRKGTKRYTSAELAEEIESLAGGIGGFSGWNSTGVSGKFLSRDFDKALGLFKEVLTQPTFPEVEIEKYRADALAAIKRQQDSLPKFTFKLFLKNLFKKHPYGMPTIGTKESVEALTRKNLLDHYRDFFVPERMVLTVVGDIDTEYVAAKMEEAFSEFDNKGAPLATPPVETRRSTPQRVVEMKEKAQTHIVVGFLGTSIGHVDSYPLRVLSDILSGQGGRLFVNLRDRQSLAYSVHAFLREAKDPGVFAVYIGCAPEKKERAIEEIFRELTDISTTAVTGDELRRAKNSIIGGYEIGLQAVSSQAGNLTNFELYGQGYDFQEEFARRIEAVTTEDILRVAKKYLKLDTATIAVVGPGEATEKSIDKAADK